ncbi:hypothetical protein ABPE25_004381 [Salmonella enterica subsp. enterica serovar Newport]|uniref:hypothetical protein n=1 Tax=Salmonella enterica TaxID=28901 RepID=UPI001D263C68|nr:hypothetical protein [Salmonella enterica subsp. enterica]EGK6998086.1 hypothetical protein [Salmonella enterica subsp. enterica serovar Newport]EHK8785535.1 hypothetical protein [Salmonella enterica subsp. enterica serovar Bardo]EJS0406571.1 hypothetical protein [Salmonella enterica subsp. enterica serovar Newport]ELC2954323.1 hypothetical protein [Salmonella enterica]
MSEFHRWQGEKLKEERRPRRRRRPTLLLLLSVIVGLLAVLELVFVVWVMSDGSQL